METGAMAKQAARRKPGAKREAAWPEAEGAESHGADVSTEPVRPVTMTGETALTSIGGARARKHGTRGAAVNAERNAAIAMGEALTAGFRNAVEAVIRDAHAEGFAVPARVNGVAVEIRPDGEVLPIDDKAAWSPADWRKATRR
jgi:hypothetical protein